MTKILSFLSLLFLLPSLASAQLVIEAVSYYRSTAMTRNIYRTSHLFLLVAAGLLFSTYALSAQESQSAARNSDREQINIILRGVEEAWNRHDMRALANLFHEDGVWILWTGHVWTGRKAIEEGHAEVHRTVFRNSIQREQLEELTFVGPDAAVLRYCSTLTGDERAPEKLIRSRKIMVVTKREGDWKIGWGQNTRFADSVPDAPACSKPKQ